MRTPDSSHPISIQPVAGRVVVKAGETVIVSTSDALALREASYPPVLYLPRADARMDLLESSALRTTCPYKGEASYFSLNGGGSTVKDAVWSYEQPYPAVSEIEGRLAFYPQHVSIEVAPE